jgi:hypothetical protein
MSDTEPRRDHNHAQSKDSDNSVRDNNAPVQIMRFAAEHGKSILFGVALGLSMAVNIVAFLAWRDARTEAQVRDYDLTFFVTHDFASLKSEVEVNQKLIDAYGLQKALKEK